LRNFFVIGEKLVAIDTSAYQISRRDAKRGD
jgi:hypothetical protein